MFSGVCMCVCVSLCVHARAKAALENGLDSGTPEITLIQASKTWNLCLVLSQSG